MPLLAASGAAVGAHGAIGAQSAILGALGVAAAAFIKGAIGFGFPALATPVLALLVDLKTIVAVLVIPNIVMDSLQIARRGRPWTAVRRLGVFLAAGGVGTVVGTHLLVLMPARTALLILGCVLLLFVALSVSRLAPRIPPAWEPWCAPPLGFVAGLVGGVTNVPGTPVVLYLYALGLDKREFVRGAALTFLVYKVVQLGSVVYYGLLTWRLLGFSLGLTALALVAFGLGLRVQDRLDQRAFNRLVLVFLGALGAWLAFRSLP